MKTKLREAMFFLLVMIGLLPRLLVAMNPHVSRLAFLKFVPSQLGWPWSGAGRLMLGDSMALSIVSAAGWLAVSWLFSRNQFERSIRYDGTAAHSRISESRGKLSAESWSDRIFRIPSRFFPDPFAALAEKELRTLSRIPRFRLVYVMSCFFGLIFYIPQMRRARPDSFFMQNSIVLMSLYGLLMLGQISYWNSFGFDRSAVQGYFSWPIRFRDVLIAKNLTILLLLVPQIVIISAGANAVHIPITPAKVVETIAVMFITSLYWLGLGNICSVRMPRALDPDKMNQMSNKMQAMTILAAPVVLLPLVLAYWARWFFENELVFAGLVLVAAIIGGIFYWVGLDSAVNTANAKREAMLTELSRCDGPLSVN